MTQKKSEEHLPLQAGGGGPDAGKPDGVAGTSTHGRSGKNESAGGAYPNPHKDKKTQDSTGGFMGHGGQSDMAYHGTGQLGETEVPEQENVNAPTKHG